SLQSRLSEIEARLASPPTAERGSYGEKGLQTPPSKPGTDLGSRGGGSRAARGPLIPREMDRPPKASLIASRSSGDWQLYVDLQHNLEDVQVCQSSKLLARSIASETLFGPLTNLTTPLDIVSGGSVLATVPLLSNEKPILFFRHQGEFAT